jgi:hypothetical protein
MATLVTVHGTGATGEETGPKWWQKSSAFEKSLRDLIQASDGPISYEQLIWDGNNSETSRRAAARNLLRRLCQLETAREPYVVVGHSHGGSVIGFALQLAARQKNTLPNMRAWITVGTPFIAPQKKALLYARADAIGKGVVMIGTLLVAALAVQFWSLNGAAFSSTHVLTVAAALLAAGAGVWWGSRNLAAWLEGDQPDWELSLEPNITAVAGAFGDRWLQLWHPDDEAIFLLRSAHAHSPRIFDDGFAAGPLFMAFIYALPFLVLAVAASDVLSGYIAAALAQSPPADPDALHVPGAAWFSDADVQYMSLLQRFAMIALAVPVLIARTLEWLRGWSLEMPYVPVMAMAVLVAAVSGLLLARLAMRALSIPVSRQLNAATVSQIRAKLFGADVSGETAIGCDVRPYWSKSTMGALPAAVSAEITEMSDRAAERAVRTMRARAYDIVAAENPKERLSEYLSWEELVHTTYFNAPTFQRLLAYAISTVDGFRATPVLTSDASYSLLRQWLDEVRRPAPSAAPEAGVELLAPRSSPA